MGSPASEAGRTGAEGPQTNVTLSRPFWLGTTLVTHGQWKALMGTDLAEQARKATGHDSDFVRLLAQTDDAVAMYFVNWDDAMALCEKLNDRARAEGSLPSGYAYTLPTEAQWEYACRAGASDATYAGPLPVTDGAAKRVLDPLAWYSGNSSDGYDGPPWNALVPMANPASGAAGPRRVGLKEPNAWGLFDMMGNLYEWCRDFSSPTLPGGTVVDPVGPRSGTDRMVRGGSWHSTATTCRSAYRAWCNPDVRSQYVGFRVALAPLPDSR